MKKLIKINLVLLSLLLVSCGSNSLSSSISSVNSSSPSSSVNTSNFSTISSSITSSTSSTIGTKNLLNHNGMKLFHHIQILTIVR